eukprot:CAMPEP_0185165464 /NCGR_PEP_ID=MMETSP1139-20130426/10927_1 /TAXON_ID=298111 /ORGANISM="Pavlova sp., Strain CCMP459" /LENGTH=39 /DNA_ID= /DNA_START= /DNA_END= /DNA_ORIENTATION=
MAAVAVEESALQITMDTTIFTSSSGGGQESPKACPVLPM